jgi:hypothetical protein
MSQRPARFDTGGATAEEIAAWEEENRDAPDDAPPLDEDAPPIDD